MRIWPFKQKQKEPVEEPAPEKREIEDFGERIGIGKRQSKMSEIQYRENVVSSVFDANFNSPVLKSDTGESIAMDEAFNKYSPSTVGAGVPNDLILWYGAQGFIGHQMCALISQNWLVKKAMSMPAKDAVRNGWAATVNDGEDAPEGMQAYIRRRDKAFGIKKHLVQMITMGRTFGVRHCLFKIDGVDYSRPFNPDGITDGSYRGIVQIDPQWISPVLTGVNARDPLNSHYYEPEYWEVNGQLIHRSHLVIFITDEAPDVLKPGYNYGGIPIPQKIYERVYGAERSVSEGPNLLMTKRLNTYGTDAAAAVSNETDFTEQLAKFNQLRDNYGVKVYDKEAEEIGQFDTALSDVDSVIMTQYQIVAAAAEVPSTKLLGTQPKGFNSTGDYEEASYHESLSSLQELDMQPLLDRHYLCLERSELKSRFDFSGHIETVWNPLDEPTSKEQAETQFTKSQTAINYYNAGAIDGVDIREQISADPESGFSNLAKIDDGLEDGDE